MAGTVSCSWWHSAIWPAKNGIAFIGSNMAFDISRRVLATRVPSSSVLKTFSIFSIMFFILVAWFLSMSSWRTSGSYCPVSWRLLKRFLEVTLPGLDMVGLVPGF